MSLVPESFVEVVIATEEDFLKIRETLTRIGIASRKENTLYQSAHILHKQKKYYIVHFKQMFQLDGKETDFSDEDRGRLNKIITLLRDWNLLKIKDEDKVKAPMASMNQIKVLSYADKAKWKLESKYTIGRKT